MCARRFLIVVTILTLMAVGAAFAVFQWGGTALLSQATPQGHYQAPPPSSGPDYASLDSWVARPGIAEDPSGWRPPTAPPSTASGPAHVFYIHPTTYLLSDRWNAPLKPGGDTEFRTRLFVQSQASALADAGDVWAPRYRQAAYGAFLLKSADAAQALDLAYSDVSAAFRTFLAAVPADDPIVLAGHSQGSLHLMRLLADYRQQLDGRIAAAYVVGWPVSHTADLPAIGLPPCATPGQSRCLLTWLTFGDPANPSILLDAWEKGSARSGQPYRREDIICVNPITGTDKGAAVPGDNPGTLVPSGNLMTAELQPGRVGASCEEGLLKLNGDVPTMGPFVLPGNNYHVYDYALFWGAIRRDVGRRVAAWAR
ncbi:DUF3089 domain-containing protein [Sphingomonas sinipercae]|uniref:DUF3089 domain-containing protein n=1 Tax=Sphingomonas sinipercae TaxID=2714944 RepID=A0A6G7ZNL4_9SPHN|nr:DUF3089 domain-containing protein [Sphingomonas sinipercae]QIL02574.1 DUF3089 domain-containing protein [Sphingomonas sinipercae]